MNILLPPVLSLILGFKLLQLLGPDTFPQRRGVFLFKLCLAAGLGLGVSSCLYFIWLVVYGAAHPAYFAGELAVVAALTGVCYWVKRRAAARPAPHEDDKQATAKALVENKKSAPTPATAGEPVPAAPLRLRWAVYALAALAAANGAGFFLLKTLQLPSGDWDAWAFWNMRARFLASHTPYWRDCFTSVLDWSHPDYPLLLPALVARGWLCLGTETWFVPALITATFTLCTAGLLCGALQILRGSTQAALAVLALLCTPAYVDQARWQCADIPVAFFFVAAVVLLACYDQFEKSPRYLWLAGLAAGLSAWTKNEGLAFAAGLVAVRFLLYWRMQGWRAGARQAFELGKGLAPVLAVLLYFKLALAPANYLLAKQGATSLVERLVDGSRYTQVPFLIRHAGNRVRRLDLESAAAAGVLCVPRRHRRERPAPRRRADGANAAALSAARLFSRLPHHAAGFDFSSDHRLQPVVLPVVAGGGAGLLPDRAPFGRGRGRTVCAWRGRGQARRRMKTRAKRPGTATDSFNRQRHEAGATIRAVCRRPAHTP